MNHQTAVLKAELDACRRSSNPYDRFNTTVLQRPAYWSAQRLIGRALADETVRRVCVQSGHMLGKDYSAAGFALAWLTMYADSGVVIVGPKLDQVRRSTWKEVRKARAGSPLLQNAGRLGRNPMSLEYGEGWLAFVTAADSPEGLQGFHPSGPVMVIVGEASGVNDPDVNQALQSLKPVKRLDISNPLKAYGEFYEACQRGADDPSIRVIKTPSTMSPDIGIEQSPRGLADAFWLRGMIADYGIDSQTYRVRVGAEFPDGGNDLLILALWLDIAERTPHVPGGPIRLAIDLGLGRGGDDSVFIVRDDNGILAWEASKYLSLERSAEVAARLTRKFYIPPARVTFDAEGIGADFDNRLRAVGIADAVPYKGKMTSKNKRYVNLRGACHFALRRRLDPNRVDLATNRPQIPFSIPRDFMARFRREVRELTFESDSQGRNVLRNADEVAAALRHSPDFSVTLAQSFAFPNS